MADDWSVGDES